MSIIQEALKKAQIKLPDTPSQRQHPRPTPISTGSVKPETLKPVRKKHIKRPILILFTLLTALALILAVQTFLFWKERSIVKKDSTDVIVEKLAEKLKAAPIESASSDLQAEPKTIELPKYILNGIMYLEDGPKAILNGAMVSEGDAIDGATVTKIERTSVSLNRDGTEIVVNLR